MADAMRVERVAAVRYADGLVAVEVQASAGSEAQPVRLLMPVAAARQLQALLDAALAELGERPVPLG
jgi:hypothetical protein